MKAVQVLTAVAAVVGLSSQAMAQGAQCPSLAGAWKGSCSTLSEAGDSAALGMDASAHPLSKEGSDTLTIEQGLVGQLPCGYVQIDERSLFVGGLKSETINSPEPLASVATSEATRWDNDQLKISSAGIVKIGETIVTYTGEETYELDGAGRLQTLMKGEHSAGAIEVQCSYERM